VRQCQQKGLDLENLPSAGLWKEPSPVAASDNYPYCTMLSVEDAYYYSEEDSHLPQQSNHRLRRRAGRYNRSARHPALIAAGDFGILSCLRAKQPPTGGPMIRLTAIVCTRDRYEWLERALTSLVAQSGVEGRFDALVIDNSSDAIKAATFAEGYAHLPGFHFIHSSITGLSNARNLGAVEATGDVVAYLDDDAIAKPHWAATLIEAFERFGNRVGIVGGPVRPIWEKDLPFPITPAFRDLFSIVDRGDTLREMNEGEWLAGCNIAFNRRALLEAGGFAVGLGRTANPAALLSNEETAVCAAIRSAGKTMVYAPDALVDHFIPAERSCPEWVIRRIAWQSVSDAISDPTKARERSRRLNSKRRIFGRFRRAFALMRFWHRYRNGLCEKDYDLIYDVVVEMLCIGL
jgi:glycosyltransferase involved in cell wall biosynthesis